MLSNGTSSTARYFILLCLSFLLISCDEGSGPDAVPDVPPSSESLTLVWADEFDTDGSPDVRNWTMETGYGDNGWGNQEWQLYTNDTASENNNVRVENGNLIITARCSGTQQECANQAAADKTGMITSARINTKDKFEVKYGNIQARIKTPPGKGMWPAFWMLGSVFPEQPWPGAGEIDIMEMHQFFSNDRTTHFTVHFCDDAKAAPAECKFENGWTFDSRFLTFDLPLTTDYHVFELDWDENRIIGKIDGTTYYSRPTDPETNEEFLRSFFMILNIAVGGTLGGPPSIDTEWPQSMMVDWVRVYKKDVPGPDVLEVVPENSAEPLPFVRTINSVEFGGDSVVSDIASTAVTPLAGDTVVEFDYRSGNTFFSGAAFNFRYADLTKYSKFVFALDTTLMPSLADIGIEISDVRFTGDGTPGRVNLPLSNYDPVSEQGNWQRYEIPMADFNGVDMQNVQNVGFWNPVDSSSRLVAGKLYLDDIKFVRDACITDAAVTFDSDLYNPDTSVGSVTVNDACNASRLAVVKIETDTGAIGVGVDLDTTGAGTSKFNIAKSNSVCDSDDTRSIIKLSADSNPLTATYSRTDILADGTPEVTTVTDVAGVDPDAPGTSIIGDKRYFYATDPAQTLGFIPDSDYFFTPFGSGSTFNGAFPDSTFDPSFAVTSGDNYGGGIHIAQLILWDGDGANPDFAGFAEGSETFNFKVKDLPVDNVIDVGFGVLGVSEDRWPVDVTTSEYVTDIGDGWYEVRLPMSLFPNLSNYDYLIFEAGIGTTDQFTFLVTDIFLQDAAGSLPEECNEVIIEPSDGDTIGVYSETNTDPVITYDRIINAAEFFGNQTVPDENSMDVTPFDGTVSLEADFQDSGQTYGGIIFEFQGGRNISDYITLKFAIDTSLMPTFADIVIQPEDGSDPVESVYLSSYEPTSIVGDWSVYEIPLSDFPDLDKTSLTLLGFWNASQTEGDTVPLAFGQLYLDDIHFSKLPPAAPARIGLYSETNTDPVVTYDRIINAAEFFGNQTVPDESSTNVTPYDGVVSLEADFQDSGQTYGGIIFEFQGGRDIDQYLRLRFAIDTSLMPTYADIVIQPEDGTDPVESVFLSDYPPVSISGNWSIHEIPLSAFPNLDKTNLTLLGFWNASQTEKATVPLAFGQLYFDDIHFEK